MTQTREFLDLPNFFEQIKWLPNIHITVIDVVQIIVLTLAIYYLTTSLYKTRAWIVVKGLIAIGIVYIIICMMHMTELEVVIQNMFGTIMIAIVIMLQPDLQRIIEVIGKKKIRDIKSVFSKKPTGDSWFSEETIEHIAKSCVEMGKVKTGALIVLERSIPVTEYINSGIQIDGIITRQLLINIFEKNTPLHDGAVIVRNNKVTSATSYLPLSTNDDIDKHLGTRHRAAIGATENSDCIVIVVSEETGAISFVCGGKIKYNLTEHDLVELLQSKMSKDKKDPAEKKRISRSPKWAKFVAPILGVFVWLAVMTSNDPVITKIINNIPVTIINDDAIGTAGQTYVVKTGDMIDVKVKGPRSIVDHMTEHSFNAVADFELLSLVNSVQIEVTPKSQYAERVEVLDNNYVMKLELEELVKVAVPTEVKITGDKDPSVFFNVNNIENEKINVLCPEDIAKTIQKAVLTVDAYGKTNNFITSVPAVLYDKNDNVISNAKYFLTEDLFRVAIDVYETKDIPINVKLKAQDSSSSAFYKMENYKTEFSKIKVAGDYDVLKTIEQLDIEIVPPEKGNSIVISLKDYLPENIYLAKTQQQQMTIEAKFIKFEKITLPIKNIKSTGVNQDEWLVSIQNAPKEITVVCNTDLIKPEDVTLEKLNPIIKVIEQEAGIYEAALQLTEVDGVTFDGNFKVKYSLSEK